MGQKIGRAFGLVYAFTDELKSAYDGFGLDIPPKNGAPDDWSLPLSATYIIAKDGVIRLADAGVDYRRRTDPLTAQVTENIFDTPTGRAKLVLQGSKLIGVYDSQIAFGQSRVLLVWTRLIMPNGRSIVLKRQQGADAAGYSGLEDQVDNHWKELLGAAALSTLLSVGIEVNSGGDINNTNGVLIQALRRGAGDSANQVGQQLVRRNLNIQPTLTICPGFPVRVIVSRDLLLEPYRG